MADVILTGILNSKISSQDVINWLTSENIEDVKWAEINNAGCTRGEFVLYFLNFLRHQTANIVHGSNNAKQTAAKPTLSHVSSNDSNHEKPEKSHSCVPLFDAGRIPTTRSPLHGIGKKEESQTPAENKSLTQLKNVNLPENKIGELINEIPLKSTNENAAFHISSNYDHIMGISDQPNTVAGTGRENVDVRTNCSGIFSPSCNTTTSTPIIKKRVSLMSVSRTPNSMNDSTSFASKSSINSSLGECFERNHSKIESDHIESNKNQKSCTNDFVDTRIANENINVLTSLSYGSEGTSSFANNFVMNETKDRSGLSNVSLQSENCSRPEISDSNPLNKSVRSRNSTRGDCHFVNSTILSNEIHQSPISPLYINNVSMTTPPNSKTHNKSMERYQNTNNSPQPYGNTTPKDNASSTQRNVKSGTRQNVSLGDFITIDTRGSRKSSTKKGYGKSPLLKHSDGEGQVTERLSVKDEIFPEVGKNSGRRKRRIKPTRLDVSDNKGNKESEKFGIITRPSVANPQFSEALPCNELSDKMSFEAERDLLKLERQKQQKPSLPEPDECPTKNLIRRTPSKTKPPGPSVTPLLSLVENKETLNILAKIYSTLLDYNLVLNPMTELYFAISLLTLQPPSGNNELHTKAESQIANDKSANSDEGLQDLGCMVLNENFNMDFGTSAQERSGSGNRSMDHIATCRNIANSCDKQRQSVKVESFNTDVGCPELTGGNDSSVKLLSDNTKTQLDEVNESNGKECLINIEKNCETMHGVESISNRSGEYFQTIHNCVYFSICVLNNQRASLKLLERATLKLLCECHRIATFLPELQGYLNELYKEKLNESARFKQPYNDLSSAETNVCFQIDTDNRENFASLSAFQSFRKQRDLFYEALRIWEENHLVPGWLFSIALASKIRALLALYNDVWNCCHFVRLFKSQLLISCIRNGPQEDPMDDESLSFLKSLKHLNPEKLTRLRERLVTPVTSRGLVPPPAFPGVQEFFKDFILHAFNPMFYAHLQDCLVNEIMELNDTQFNGSEIEDTETMVDEETKQNYINCLSNLRLLAKFLAFLVTLPYRCESNALDGAMASQIERRNRVLPPLNLQSCLQNAIIKRKLSLTIPWAVEYLAMLDPVSLRLSYYKACFELLFHIYRESSHCIGEREDLLPLQTAVLLKFCLGWLFELHDLPKELYYSWRSSQGNRKLRAIRLFAEQPSNVIPTETAISVDSTIHFSQSLDNLDIIDDRALYVCCPFLTELKILMAMDNSSLSNSSSIRHITPVSSELSRPVGGTNAKQLELQLEEAFFHGQPASVRKTVDFVSERVASSCVKHICNSLLPIAREKNVNAFKEIISKQVLPDKIHIFKSLMSKELHSIASYVSKEIRKQCDVDVLSMCESRTTRSMESLLAEDALPSVKQMCAQIAIRMAKERINHWIQSHIVGGSLFIKDMEAEIDRVYKNKIVLKAFEKREHNPEAACPTDVLYEFRSLFWELLDNRGQSLTVESVSQSLDRLHQSLTEREDLLAGPEKIMCSMSVDLALFLAAHRTDLFVTEIHDKLIKIWNIKYLNFSELESVLSRVLCPRNIMLLAQSQKEAAWLSLGELLRKSLKENILSIEVLSDQCTVLLRQNWPVPILKNLSKCLTEVIREYKSSSQEMEKIKILLEWIAETCNEIDFNVD